MGAKCVYRREHIRAGGLEPRRSSDLEPNQLPHLAEHLQYAGEYHIRMEGN